MSLTGGNASGSGADRIHSVGLGTVSLRPLLPEPLAIRHHGDDGLTHSASVTLDVERYRLEWSTPAAQSCNLIGQNNPAGVLIGAGRDLLCQDCNRGGPVVRTQPAIDFTIEGIARWGSTGAFDSENTDGLRVEDLLQVGGGGLLPSRVDGFVVALESGSRAARGTPASRDPERPGARHLGDREAMISTLDDGVLENVALFDVDTTRACAGECARAPLRGNAGAGDDRARRHRSRVAGRRDALRPGRRSGADGPRLHGGRAARLGHEPLDGRWAAASRAPPPRPPPCSPPRASGRCSTTTECDAQSPASLPPSAVLGVAPGFVDAAARRFDTAPGSAADLAQSGIRRGVEAPGVKRYRWIHAITRTVPEALADDPDGDGVRADPEAQSVREAAREGCSDNCPAIFNPDQADADGNAQGDLCQGPCRDGLDNDGDGLADFPADPGCRDALASLENPQCQDGLNNDPGQDARIDWDGGASAGLPPAQRTAPDPQCAGRPWRNLEGKVGCGLGFELVLVLPLLALRRARGATAPRRAGTPSRCARRGRARRARPRRSTRSSPKTRRSSRRIAKVAVGANAAVIRMLLIWIQTCPPQVTPSGRAKGAMKRPVARAPQVPPIPWTPNTSRESS